MIQRIEKKVFASTKYMDFPARPIVWKHTGRHSILLRRMFVKTSNYYGRRSSVNILEIQIHTVIR